MHHRRREPRVIDPLDLARDEPLPPVGWRDWVACGFVLAVAGWACWVVAH